MSKTKFTRAKLVDDESGRLGLVPPGTRGDLGMYVEGGSFDVLIAKKIPWEDEEDEYRDDDWFPNEYEPESFPDEPFEYDDDPFDDCY